MSGRRVAAAAGVALSLLLSGCAWLPTWMGGAPDRPKPAELARDPGLLSIRQAWTARLGPVDLPLEPQVNGNTVTLASSDGTVLALDAESGRELWRASLGTRLSAGVGSDGRTAAVVTRDNELVVLGEGKTLWRAPLGAQGYTAPLVAGGRVFVLGGDRSVSAYDGATGRRLWNQQRPGEPLVLRQGGVMLAVGDTLVAGQGGRLAGLDPLTGAVRWEAPVGTSRGTNDVERLVDLVGRVSRVGDSVCTRAFQTSVGCVDASQGGVQWSRPAKGSEGVHGDSRHVFGTESDGKLIAWRREDGERAWVTDRLQWRSLTAPLLIGRSVAVGDSTGFVHMLSREDGSLLTRLSTDGSAVAAGPVQAGNTLVVVTRKGGIFGFVPN